MTKKQIKNTLRIIGIVCQLLALQENIFLNLALMFWVTSTFFEND
jgi:hypothetical protein